MTDTTVTDATGASAKPATKPARPYFSSGPCAKPPGWDAAKLATDVARSVAPVEARQATRLPIAST